MLEKEIDIKSKQYKIYKNLVWTVYSRIKESNEIKRVTFSKINPIEENYKITTIKNETEPFLEGEYIYRRYDKVLNTVWSNSKDNYKTSADRNDKWTVKKFLFDYVEVFDTSVIKTVNSQIYYPPVQNEYDDDNNPIIIQPPPMLSITTTIYPEFESPTSTNIIVPIPYTIQSSGIRYTYSGDDIKDENNNKIDNSAFLKDSISMIIYGNSNITFFGRYKYYDLEYKGKLQEYYEDYSFPPSDFNLNIELEETII